MEVEFLSEHQEERGGKMTEKGWSSERVALSKHSSRSRHVGSSTVALFPFSSGRTLPSKWDDAERWICSPVFGQDSNKGLHLVQSERRAKSKSGPLGPQMIGNYGNYSPVMPLTVTADSPLLGGRRRSCPGNDQDLASTREWLNLLHEPPPGAESQEESFNGVNEEEKQVRRAVSRRDMGTQMLPSEESSATYSSPPNDDAGDETDEMVKDVKVDREDTLPIKRSVKGTANGTPSSHDYTSNNNNNNSRLQREEARIDDWENLQREKAEAAIQKLEKKLEKKRSSSMEKIMKKVKRAELRAEKMRSSLSCSDGKRKASGTMAGLYRRIRMGSIADCVACR